MTSKNPAFWKEALAASPLSPAAPPQFSLLTYRHAVYISRQTEKTKLSSKCWDFLVRRLPGLQTAPSAAFGVIMVITDIFLQSFRILLAEYGNSPHFRTGHRNQIQFPLFFKNRNFHSNIGNLI